MQVFYFTFFRNPTAQCRYVLGFEPGLMRPDDLAVLRIPGISETSALTNPGLRKCGLRIVSSSALRRRTSLASRTFPNSNGSLPPTTTGSADCPGLRPKRINGLMDLWIAGSRVKSPKSVHGPQSTVRSPQVSGRGSGACSGAGFMGT